MLGVASVPSRPLTVVPQCRPKLCSILDCRSLPQMHPKSPSPLSTSPRLSSSNKRLLWSPLTPRASVGNVEFVVEPGTNVKFPRELTVPGCSDSLVLLGTGYREKVFAIIGVKVYAAGFYAERTVREGLNAWKGKSAAEILEDSSLFSSIFQAPRSKSLIIKLVREVDGKTFWNALDDVISPRIKEPTAVDESALSTFRNTFQGRDLKQGTFIYLTWAEPSKMLVCVSSNEFASNVDAIIESANVPSALFDAFFGGSPVSPTLKVSVANGFTAVLNEIHI